jgi:hypothetical protein
MVQKKIIICINWGTKYGPPYINRLYAMVARNITPPFEFVCFTDNVAGIRAEVRTEPLPPLNACLPTGTPGIWQKSRLWGPRLADLQGPVLFLDLDLVVTSNLDCFFDYGHPDSVVLCRNQIASFGRLGQFNRMGQTSVFRFPVGKLYPLQQLFENDPQGIADKYRFEQRFVTANAPGEVNFFPKRWIAHFRQNCSITFPFNFFMTPRLPRKARIVIFPSDLLPTHAIEGRWGPKGLFHSRLRYLSEVFSPSFKGNRFSGLRHFILPARWVDDVWRE